RYTAATGFAAALDLAAAWTAHTALGLPLPAAAAIGVLTGGLIAYWLLEFWAFRRPASAFSVQRLGSLLGLVAMTLILRTGFVATFAWLIPQDWAALPILVAAFGLTFTVNFIVNRAFIFRRKDTA
ncbi:MAG: GtrA family protein, partial [Pseudomonadota bacterium]